MELNEICCIYLLTFKTFSFILKKVCAEDIYIVKFAAYSNVIDNDVEYSIKIRLYSAFLSAFINFKCLLIMYFLD